MNVEVENLLSQLTESNRKMETVRKVSFELNKLMTLPEKLHSILAILSEQFGITNSLIMIPDHEKEILTVYASYGYEFPVTGRQVAFGHGIAGQAAIRRKHINLTGIRRKQHYLTTVSDRNEVDFISPIGLPDAESQVAIPLLSNDVLVAVLLTESRSFCVFDKADENFLITLAQPLAVSIQNSMLYDSMEEKIRERTAELQRLNSTKDKFFSIISHDLRGPVTSFQSLTRLFSHYNKLGQSDKIESLISKVDQSVDNLNHLLENLLDWSLSQTSGIQCLYESLRLRDFIQRVLEIYQVNLLSKEIELSLLVENDIRIVADQHTLATVFRNLISNAIKFTPRGGTITISAQAKDDSVIVLLNDSGVGIDCQKLPTLFNLQGQRSTHGTEKEKGSGLGLVLVKEFTELNRGQISIESDPCAGTLVKLTLPRDKEA